MVVVGDYPTHVWPGQWLNPAFKVEMAHVEHYANLYQIDTERLYATVTCHWINPEDLNHEEIKRGDLQGQNSFTLRSLATSRDLPSTISSSR